MNIFIPIVLLDFCKMTGMCKFMAGGGIYIPVIICILHSYCKVRKEDPYQRSVYSQE